MYVCMIMCDVLCCFVRTPTDGQLRPLVEAPSGADVQTVQFTSTKGRKTNRPIMSLIPSAVSLRIAGVEQFYQVKRVIGGIGNVLFLTHSQTLNE